MYIFKIILGAWIGMWLVIDDVKAQTGYAVQFIPDSLIQGANAVYQLDKSEFEIISETKCIQRVHQVITILNGKAKYLATVSERYDKKINIRSMVANVINANGQVVKSYDIYDFKDQSNVSGGSIYEDDRIKYLNLSQGEYPYTIEFKSEVVYKSLFYIPDWYALPSSGVSVVRSEYKLTSPENLRPKFRLTNSRSELQEKMEAGNYSVGLSFEFLKAKKSEPYSPRFSETVPVLLASPTVINYDGFDGKMNNWESFGQWIEKLNYGRDSISESTIQEIKNLTDPLDSREEKIRAVYEYMQNRTRYVSIQLGIGGWQPFEAITVDELGYGDCKALSNFTYSLLNEIGIKSLYTVVRADDYPPDLDDDFAYNPFNHAILCVPNEKDTIWLECTSQTNPFGYLGSFTGDREVMVITDQGGKIVKTPRYTMKDNKQITIGHIKIDNSGNGDASLMVEYKGVQYENNNLNWVINDGDEELKKWIYENTDIPQFNIKSFDFELNKERIPSIEENLSLDIIGLASVSGERMFIQPNLMNKWKKAPRKVRNRQNDVFLSRGFEDYDSLIYEIPSNFHVEYLPERISVENDFGHYSTSFQFENNQLIYVRKVGWRKGRFPKESYDDFRDFYRTIVRSDKAKVVFIDKT